MNGIFEGLNLEICAEPNAEQLIPIEEGLNNFNDLMTGMSDRLPLSVLIKSKTNGEVLGGMQGRSWSSPSRWCKFRASLPVR